MYTLCLETAVLLAYRSIKHIMEPKLLTPWGSCTCLNAAAVALYDNFLLFISIFLKFGK